MTVKLFRLNANKITNDLEVGHMVGVRLLVWFNCQSGQIMKTLFQLQTKVALLAIVSTESNKLLSLSVSQGRGRKHLNLAPVVQKIGLRYPPDKSLSSGKC